MSERDQRGGRWRENLPRELPEHIDEHLLDTIDDAWLTVSGRFESKRLNHDELLSVEARLRRLDRWHDVDRSHVVDAWPIASGGTELCLCLIVQDAGGEGDDSHECRLAGLYKTGADMGRATMRPETLGDRVTELFRSREVDFSESPRFSKKYYVLASDQARLKQAWAPAALDLLGARNSLFVEIHGRDVMIEWPRILCPEAAEKGCEFFLSLAPYLRETDSGPYR